MDFPKTIHDFGGLPKALPAIPTPEHYIPLIYVLGLKGKNEKVTFFNDKAVGGSITMTSVMIG
jgi:4,5-DOPA dioxygenase extradiol